VNTFEIITIAVGVGGIVLAATPWFSVGRALGELGRQGQAWFESPTDRALEVQPSEDAMDAPIPRRPLRARSLPRQASPSVEIVGDHVAGDH
jgi:hypothetical protein